MTVCLLSNTSGWLIYAFAYLLLYPTFSCDGIPETSPDFKEKCVPDYFCDTANDITWHIVEDDPKTLNNWIKRWDLYCAGKFMIGSFAMSYFAGFTIGAIFVPALSDKNGRRNWTIYSLAAQAASVLVILLLPA